MRFFMIILTIFGLVLLLASPLFNISAIHVSGNTRISDAAVYDQIPAGNIFGFSGRKAKNQLLQNPFIYHATFSRNFFTRTLSVTITERQQVAYVLFSENHYLMIDQDGRVLAVTEERTQNLPVITGLTFAPFTLGEYLDIENAYSFATISQLASLFLTYEIDPEIMSINISDNQNLILNFDLITVSLGDATHLDEKFRTALSILPSIDNFRNIGGTLDLSRLDGQWFFSLPL